MEVTFGSTKTQLRGLATHELNQKLFIFRNGIYKTTDKQEIVNLLGSEVYRRGEIRLADNIDLVSKYLEGEDPEYLSMDVLSQLALDALIELATLYGTKDRQRAPIIRAELNGKPVTNDAMEVLERYKVKATQGETKRKVSEDDMLEEVEAAVVAGRLTKAGPWYKEIGTEFKSRNVKEVYEHITKV